MIELSEYEKFRETTLRQKRKILTELGLLGNVSFLVPMYILLGTYLLFSKWKRIFTFRMGK